MLAKLTPVLTLFKLTQPHEVEEVKPKYRGYNLAHRRDEDAKWERLKAQAAIVPPPAPAAALRRASTSKISHRPAAPRHARHASEGNAQTPQRSQSLLVRRLSRHKEDTLQTRLESTRQTVCKIFDVILTDDEMLQALRSEGVPLGTSRERHAVSEKRLFEVASKVATGVWQWEAPKQARLVTELPGVREPAVRVATPIEREATPVKREATPPLHIATPPLPPRNPRRLSQFGLLAREVEDWADDIARGWNETPASTTASGSIYTQPSAVGSVVSVFSATSAQSYRIDTPPFAD